MALAGISTNVNTELLQIADAVAREKGVNKELVIDSMEQAIEVAGRRKYGTEHNIEAEIDRKTGAIRLYRVYDVVEAIDTEEDEHAMYRQLTLEDARERDAEAEIGGRIREALPPIDLGRVAAQTAKQVITQKVREAEREKQYEEFKDRADTLLNGVVKRVEYGNVWVDVGVGEALLPKNHLIARETFRIGDRVRAYIQEVRQERTAPQIILSRTHPEFLIKLFAQEVPEVYEGIIEIRKAVRDPGSRAKMTVYSHDPSIDPVGSCVGVRGSRVQAVVQELQGEKVDIIPWAPETATLVVNALAPAEVSKVVLDEDNHRIEVVVPEDQQSLAIGRRGQNVRLASELTNMRIDVMTEDEEAERRSEEFNNLSVMFVDALNIDDVMAHLLVAEGFHSIDQIAYVPVEDLATIDGFDEDIAEELRNRARDYVDENGTEIERKLRENEIEPELMALPIPGEILLELSEKGIKTRDDLGDLSSDELADMLPYVRLSEEEANRIIMEARAHWFAEEEGDAKTAESAQ